MRKLLCLLAGLIALQTALAGSVAAAELKFGRYHALVIGNNDYRNLPKLNTASSEEWIVSSFQLGAGEFLGHRLRSPIPGSLRRSR